ncbi:MAG: hypothetical protein FD170_1700 [Bacteroidetes bacterium]|nr:MAG: hypothetical protein FD170_1700 [Bacteroidota bacterium]
MFKQINIIGDDNFISGSKYHNAHKINNIQSFNVK